MATRNLAIMFTDIQGFTARTSSATREGIHDLLDAHEKVLHPVFTSFRGNVVKTIGDAFLVWFESPTDAVLCGLTIQEVLRQRNESVSEGERLNVRVAINAGDVELRQDPATGNQDIFGEPVNLAARLEGITEAGEVWFTEAVWLTMNRAEAPSTEIGERSFKGIPNPVRVYKVLYEPGSEHARELASRVKIDPKGRPSISREMRLSANAAGSHSNTTRWVAIGAILVAIVLAGALVGQRHPWFIRHRVLREAVRLVKEKKDAEALDRIGVAADRGGLGPALSDLARSALDAELARRMSSGTDGEPAATDAWLTKLGTKHPGLAPIVEERQPSIHIRAVIFQMASDGTDNDEFWQTIRKELKAHPDDKRIHLAAADAIVETKHWIAALPLWLYEQAFEEGHPVDPKVFPLCTKTFESYGPTEEWGSRAQEVAGKYFAGDMDAWSRKTLASTTALYPFINAQYWLAQKKDSAADAPEAAAILNLLHGKDTAAAKKTIEALEPAEKERVNAILLDSTKRWYFQANNRDEVSMFVNQLAGRELVKIYGRGR